MVRLRLPMYCVLVVCMALVLTPAVQASPGVGRAGVSAVSAVCAGLPAEMRSRIPANVTHVACGGARIYSNGTMQQLDMSAPISSAASPQTALTGGAHWCSVYVEGWTGGQTTFIHGLGEIYSCSETVDTNQALYGDYCSSFLWGCLWQYPNWQIASAEQWVNPNQYAWVPKSGYPGVVQASLTLWNGLLLRVEDPITVYWPDLSSWYAYNDITSNQWNCC